jgi:Alpha amylase, catalytic domain
MRRDCLLSGARICCIALLGLHGPAMFSQSVKASHASPRALHTVPWYVTAAAIHRVSLKPNTQFWRYEHLSLKPAESQAQLRAWKAEGIDTIEIFAPEEGGNSYNGLDAKNRYVLDPGLGTMADFKRVVAQAQALQMHVVTFQNLGYAAIDAPQFEKAEEDVRAGRTTQESQFFLWSDRADAPAPAGTNSYFFVRPNKPGYDPTKSEFWQWSERAQHFYWTRWAGKDANGAVTHLPQYNWSSNEWQEEAKKVVAFWMSTGLDGMIVDAVNWYVGYDWQKNADLLASYRKFPGDKLLVPEGGGAFHSDDPVGWIRDGNWTALYDYGLDIWWEKQNRQMQQSIDDGDPAKFDEAMRNYHDRVVAAGGVLIQPVLDMKDEGKQRLEEGLLATSGDMLCYCERADSIVHPAVGVSELLRLKTRHPALYQNSTRRRIATDHDSSTYATVRYAANGSERVLVVFNFSSRPQNLAVDAGAIAGTTYRDLESDKAQHATDGKLNLELAGYGHRIFKIEER